MALAGDRFWDDISDTRIRKPFCRRHCAWHHLVMALVRWIGLQAGGWVDFQGS